MNKFEGWLFEHFKKSLEDVNQSDLRAYEELKRNIAYVRGVSVYYEHIGKNEIADMIVREIRPKLRKYRPKDLLRWTDFRNIMKQAEKKRISDKDRALLNILWSCMKTRIILELRRSDIDFEKRVVTSRVDLKTYRLTPEAWDALEKYILPENRDEKKLFPIGVRAVTTITEKYSDMRKITPNLLRKSCEADFIEEGKKRRFSIPDKKPSIRIEKPPKKKQKRRLFTRLVEEIENFGSKAHYRISKIKDETEFQNILEGYLRATFPEDIISREFRFEGYEGDSRIDFAVGKAQKIPIEVKFAKEKIRDYRSKGSGQVEEFLESRRIKKGILVIGIKDRGRAHELAQKFKRLKLKDVHVIII